MKVVCIVTDENNPGFTKWLQPSCSYQNLALTPIIYRGPYRSHKLKDMLLLEYIKRNPKNEIILFTDAFDTVLLSNESEILEKFYKFNSPLVFSAEANCWPDVDLAQQYPTSVQDFQLKYLNSGGFIGESTYIKDLIERYYANSTIDHLKYQWSNQYIWNQIYSFEHEVVKLDHEGDIFYTLSSDVAMAKRYVHEPDHTLKAAWLSSEKTRILQDVSFDEDRIIYKRTGSMPCHLHFNSPFSKQLMQTDFFDKLMEWKL